MGIRPPYALLAIVALAACTPEAPPRSVGPGPRLPEKKARVRNPPRPSSWFWEPVEAEVRGPAPTPLELPIAESKVRRIEGTARIWDELPPDARERLRRDGVLVLGSEVGGLGSTADGAKQGGSFGAFYTHLRGQRIPHVITLDALVGLVHLGVAQALAVVEEVELAPVLQTLIDRLDARLGAEHGGAGTELLDAYRIARGIVSVARALSSTPHVPPPRDLAAVVNGEVALIEASTGPATSPLLGVPVDYARFAPPDSAARPGAFRALAWLGAAPLTLVARSEAAGSPIDAARARTNTRAAMLLARLCDHDIDPAINDAYTRIQRLRSFVWGPADDLTLTELDDVAASASVDLTNPQNIANVVRVDKVRRRALAGRSPAVHDGSGGVGRGGLSVRLFGGHAAPDSLVLQEVAGDGKGPPPSALDVAAWMGAPEARALLREVRGEGFEMREAALGRVIAAQKLLDEGALHASIHGSFVDALIAWANESPSSGIERTAAAERLRVESILSAWTLIRHTGLALARARPVPPREGAELRVSGQPLPVLVEPMPDVIARLAGMMRQLRRGLTAIGAIAPTSPTTTMLAEIEDILRAALVSAERDANDLPASPEEASTLASLPARIARLEEGAPLELGPVTAVIHSDSRRRQSLVTATGRIEPMLVLARTAGARDETMLVVGAHVAHHELFEAPGAPKPARAPWPWATSFRWTR